MNKHAILWWASMLFLLLGFASNITALFFIGDDTGETLHDVGTSTWLFAGLLLLIRLSAAAPVTASKVQ